jgi:catechol 2,3-dioxygenase-like lactoylglutathione lyase family enzyme
MKLVEIAYFTDKLDEMVEYYEKFLNIEPAERSGGMATFMLSDVKLFLHQNYTPEDGELPPEDHKAFEVLDLDVMYTELRKQGFMIEVPPKEYYWGYSAYMRDPDGNLIELIQTEKS